MFQIPSILVNLAIVGGAGTCIVSIILATVVFDKVSPESGTSQDMEMGVKFLLTDQHLEVYQDVVLLLNIQVDILNIKKTDENGENAEDGAIGDLFPIGDPAHGRGSVQFKIRTISKEEMPDLSKNNQESVAMAFVKESTFNEFTKSFLKLSIFMIKYAGILTWMGILFALSCIMLGAGLLLLEKAKAVVEPLEDEDDDDPEKY